MKAQIRKNQKDWHIYIFWIILGAFALLFIVDAFSGMSLTNYRWFFVFAACHTSITSVPNNGSGYVVRKRTNRCETDLPARMLRK